MACCWRVTAYVILVTLLLCPYLCLGRVATACGTDFAANDCRDDDCCCPSPVSDSNKDRPRDSDSGRQGGTCLCHGAVLQPPIILPSVDAGFATFAAVDELSAATSSIFVDRLFAVEHAMRHFSAADSGRAVRALIESLLL